FFRVPWLVKVGAAPLFQTKWASDCRSRLAPARLVNEAPPEVNTPPLPDQTAAPALSRARPLRERWTAPLSVRPPWARVWPAPLPPPPATAGAPVPVPSPAPDSVPPLSVKVPAVSEPLTLRVPPLTVTLSALRSPPSLKLSAPLLTPTAPPTW